VLRRRLDEVQLGKAKLVKARLSLIRLRLRKARLDITRFELVEAGDRLRPKVWAKRKTKTYRTSLQGLEQQVQSSYQEMSRSSSMADSMEEDNTTRFFSIIAALSELKVALKTNDPIMEIDDRRGQVRQLLEECQTILLTKKAPEELLVTKNASLIRHTNIPQMAINVLIVDDDVVAATLLTKLLARLNMQSEYVLSGMAALNKLCKDPSAFQLVLCDVNMPGLDGGGVLRHIVKDPRLSRIPIVMVSADSDSQKAQDLVEAGARDYILKPVKQISLVSLSFKVQSWHQAPGETHLQNLYETTASLLVHAKVYIEQSASATTSSRSNNNSLDEESCLQKRNICIEGVKSKEQSLVRPGFHGLSLAPSMFSAPADDGGPAVVFVEAKQASNPIREMLGLSAEDISDCSIDMMVYVCPEDRDTLREAMLDAVLGDASKDTLIKVNWQWVDTDNNRVPVTGTITPCDDLGTGEILIECTSLVPELERQREEKRRICAEKKANEAMELSENLLGLLETKETRSCEKKLADVMMECSEFSRMVAENPKTLTWRIAVKTGEILYVSDVSCLEILGYDSSEVIGRLNSEFLMKGEAAKMEQAFKSFEAARVRRITKDGKPVLLESQPYSWWDKEKTVVVVTECAHMKLWF